MLAIVSFECVGAIHSFDVNFRRAISLSQSFNFCTFRLVLLRLTCSWGWHRTLGTASVIIRILQIAGCEVVLFSAKLSMNPQLDCTNTIAFLQGSPNVWLASNWAELFGCFTWGVVVINLWDRNAKQVSSLTFTISCLQTLMVFNHQHLPQLNCLNWFL